MGKILLSLGVYLVLAEVLTCIDFKLLVRCLAGLGNFYVALGNKWGVTTLVDIIRFPLCWVLYVILWLDRDVCIILFNVVFAKVGIQIDMDLSHSILFDCL